MKSYRILLICTLNCLFAYIAISQDCDCTILDVESNAVLPCEYSIGEEILVSSVSEFKNAINLTNNAGGNKTILIADGTYQIASSAWYPYITASNVVIRSASGNRDAVILTGTGMAAVSGTENGIYAVGDNITIADLTIREVGNHGIAVTGDNLFVYNVKIQDTYEQMLKGNYKEEGVKNGKVKCSLFEYTSGIGPQWYIGGLDIHSGKHWTVSDNIFKDIASPSGSLAEHAVHFWNHSEDNIVERNQIINCDRGIGFGLGSSPNTGGTIKNNMIYNDGQHPFNDVGIGLETSPNTKVYNNTIFISYPNAIEYRFIETSNVDIVNNLCNNAIKSRNGGTANLSSNLTNGEYSWFSSPESGNLRIVDNISMVVNAGADLPELIYDVDKTIRAEHGIIDIGAFEFLQSTSSAMIESSTKGLRIYPNPTQNYFFIESAELQIKKIHIYDGLLKSLLSIENAKWAQALKINSSKWPVGHYYCQIWYASGKREVVKLFISK